MNGITSPGLRHHGWILLVAGLVFFTNLGSYPLFDDDEPKNAVCGKEMFERDDWIVPTFNHELRTDKPILIYWIMLTSFHLFGVSEFSARLGSAVLALCTSLLLYQLARRLADRPTACVASLILCTCLMFSAVGRAVTPDATLIFCITAVFTAYVVAVSDRQGGRFGGADGERCRGWEEYLPATRRASVPLYAAMGLAVLAKGPVGFVLPCAVLGTFLLLLRRRDRLRSVAPTTPDRPWWQDLPLSLIRTFHPALIVKTAWRMRILFGAAVAGCVALPWYLAVGIETDGAWLAGFLGRHNVGRFLAPMENHRGPFFYYLPVVLLGTFPWSVFLLPSVWRLVTQIRRSTPAEPAALLLICWAGLWIGFFSLARTKLPNYVLPAYPALAIGIALCLNHWLRDLQLSPAMTFRRGCQVLTVVGGLALMVLPIALQRYLPEESWLSVVGLIPLAGGGFALWSLRRKQPRLAGRGLLVMGVVLSTFLIGYGSRRVGRYLEAPALATAAREITDSARPQVGAYEYFTPSLVYYVGDRVEKLVLPADVGQFFRDNPDALVITRDDRLHFLAGELPPEIQILHRQGRFLRQHGLVTLGRPREPLAAVAGNLP